MIHLCIEPFSVENGLLTPTFKLRRLQARVHFAAEIESLYEKLETATVNGTFGKSH